MEEKTSDLSHVSDRPKMMCGLWAQPDPVMKACQPSASPHVLAQLSPLCPSFSDTLFFEGGGGHGRQHLWADSPPAQQPWQKIATADSAA